VNDVAPAEDQLNILETLSAFASTFLSTAIVGFR